MDVMDTRIIALAALVLIAVAGVARAEVKRMERIVIAKDGRSFAFAGSGKPFVPRGFNYDRDYKMRLLEEYWDTEWPTVQQDFAEMKKLGANVVRVHLQFGRFMQSADKSNPKALDQLERLVGLAETDGLYLDLTGLACYRKADVPEWYDKLTEEQRWRAQAVFWGAVAARCAGHPGVFCYDIMNEPVVPSGRLKDGAWLGSPFAGFCYVQWISLDQKDRPRSQIARAWLRAMTAAIRKHDPRTLVTVGLVDWSFDEQELGSGFGPTAVAGQVDFLCVHDYPNAGKVPEALAILKRFAVGKPVLIEETFPMNCSPSELREFLRGSEDYAAGWIGFYWGKTLDECRKSGSMGDAFMVGWLELFEQEAKRPIQGNVRRAP